MNRVASKDGTTIAYDRVGQGPAVVLVDGALVDRATGAHARLAALLAGRHTVLSYDRRGRGDSGDTPPYALQRELEDLTAVMDAAGGQACVYAHSSGAGLALEAVRRGLPATRLALYEPPFIVDASRAPLDATLVAELRGLLAAGRRDAAVELFMRSGTRAPEEVVARLPSSPSWPRMQAMAHTLMYDFAVMAGGQEGRPLPAGRWASVHIPTLVLVGGRSPTWMHHAVHAVAEAVPNARRRTLEGEAHNVDPGVLAPVLGEFFAG